MAFTYFVRKLGFEPSFHSRLARSTILSKTRFAFRLSGALQVLQLALKLLETCCLLILSDTRDEPFKLTAIGCCLSTRTVDFVGSFYWL